MKTLIIEDEEDTAESMKEILESLSYKVHVAAQLDKAREMSASGGYDLVFLDHFLPETRGERDSPVGYYLVGYIRQTNPNAVIVGISSLTPEAILRPGCDRPDCTMDKTNPREEGIIRKTTVFLKNIFANMKQAKS